MIAYQLLARLKYLALAGYNTDEQELEWIGTQAQWSLVDKEEKEHEQN